MQAEEVTKTSPNVLSGLLTRADMRSQLGGKTDRTIIRYERAGMPFIAVGAMRLYDPVKVRDWLLSHESTHSVRKPGRPSKKAA